MIMKKWNKRGIESYLSWILIFAFMVAISAMMYSVMMNQVETQTENLEDRVDTNLCEDSGITIIDYCQDEYSLIINITNTKTQRVEGLKIDLFDIYDEPFQTEIEKMIDTGETETLELLKHGTLIQAEITPLIKKSRQGDVLFFIKNNLK